MNAQAWSPPDAQGIRTCVLDVGAHATLRGKRQRRAETARPDACATWPESWKLLAREWLGGSPGKRRWSTLTRIAGMQRMALAQDLLDALLHAGWIELEEKREQGRWVPQALRFQQFETRRAALGLPDRDHLAALWQQRARHRFDDALLDDARQHLDGMTPTLALRRLTLLEALQRWQHIQRSGTHRDFALFASDDTKGIPRADWQWLENTVDLSAFGIDTHIPLLLMRAPLRCAGFDLARAPDFVGLTPATVEAMERLDGRIGQWRLVENRTSFERAARYHGDRDAVVWLPGYPPGWWQAALKHLLRLAPATARIACDPDPAGIEIALQAAQMWERAGLKWSAWQMGADVFERLPATRPLSDDDRRRLMALDPVRLPMELAGLRQAMLDRGLKGEQEGLDFGPGE